MSRSADTVSAAYAAWRIAQNIDAKIRRARELYWSNIPTGTMGRDGEPVLNRGKRLKKYVRPRHEGKAKYA